MSAIVKLIMGSNINETQYSKQFVGCLVLTKDNRILLQKRGHDWSAYPDYLCEFGGRMEKQEQPVQAIIRELKEELGAQAHEEELIPLGAITESTSNYTELIYTYFWHDKYRTITGCSEGEARFLRIVPVF
ncbi:TPA: NUDIX domain-containing protein [Legionella bozemanae]